MGNILLIKNNLIVGSALLAILPHAVYAAEAAQPDPKEAATNSSISSASGNDIVVVAQKRRERLQDVPISIAAVSGEAIAKRGLTNLRDLSTAAIGLQATSPYANSNTKFTIRGVGATDFTQNYQSPIGVYADEVFLGSPIDSSFALFDLDHAEVLRGPQGTLFGKNTTGGAISIFSALPKQELEGYASIRVGNYGYYEPSAAISLPVTSNLAVRIAGVLRKRDGTLENLADSKHLNNIDQKALRVSALYTPDNGFTALLTVGSGWNDSDGMFAQPYLDVDGDPFKGTYGGFGLERIRASNATLKLTQDLGAMTLTSISAVRGNKLRRREEPDSYLGASGDFQVEWHSTFRQVSQELRLASDQSSPLNWMAGLYYYQDRLRANNSAQFPDPTEDFALNFRLHQDVRDFAVFGQGTYSLTSALRFTLGGRYTTSRQKFTYQNRFVPMSDPFGENAAPALDYAENRTYNAWSGKIGLEYEASRDNLLYANISRGFNSGGHAGLAFSAAELASTDPEYLIAYEVGSKNSFFDGKVSLNLSAFYYDYRDIIVTTTVDTGNATLASLKTNAAKARSKGFEIEAGLRPASGLSITAGAAYLDAKYTRFNSALLAGDFSGNRLPSSPRWTMTGTASYEIPVADGKSLTFSGDVQHVTSFYRDAANTPEIKLSARTIVNSSATLKLGGGLSFSIWAKNLFNEKYLTDAFFEPSITSVTGGLPYGYFYGDPRTYGGEITIRF